MSNHEYSLCLYQSLSRGLYSKVTAILGKFIDVGIWWHYCTLI